MAFAFKSNQTHMTNTTNKPINLIEASYRLLEQKQLKPALDNIGLLIMELKDWTFSEELHALHDTYGNLLRYFEEGIKDPSRDAIFDQLRHSAYELADRVYIAHQTKLSPLYYFEKKRYFFTIEKVTLSELLLRIEDVTGKLALNAVLESDNNTPKLLVQEMEYYTIRLFHYVWLTNKLTSDEKTFITDILHNPILPEYTRCLMVTALTLSLLVYWDEEKLLLLLHACEIESEEVNQRALTGVLLALRKYDQRLPLYPAIDHRLQHLRENHSFIKNVRNILKQFIQSKDTEKITRRINEEILPEMMKLNPILSKKIKLDDLMIGEDFDDKNPEWQQFIEEAGLNDKLQEFTELQMEGADVMHSSFAHLKTHPFFSELSNWFLPFNKQHSVFQTDFNDTTSLNLLSAIGSSTFLCNSDRFSLYISIAQMPDNYKKMVANQFSSEVVALSEIQKSELPNPDKKAMDIASQYIRDLYRFYKLYPQKSDFDDIFDTAPDFFQTVSIARLIADKESLQTIGEYYFTKGYYPEAAEIFDRLMKMETPDFELYQKKGYCLQMTGHWQEALDTYLKAEAIHPSNKWTLNKLAYCYRMLKKPEEALHYYRRLEQIQPDNLPAQLNIGHCYLELKNYAEALKYYFKVEYLDKDGSKAWRPIAWCSFLTGKYTLANDYFEKIIASGKAGTADLLNSGHTQWAMGHLQQAIAFYKQSIEYPENNFQHFEDAFRNDIPDLVQAGINACDIPFVLDKLRYLTMENN